MTTWSPYAAITRFSSGIWPFSARRYRGDTYRIASSIGITCRLPRMTRDPCWFHSDSCCEMAVFWLIRASI